MARVQGCGHRVQLFAKLFNLRGAIEGCFGFGLRIRLWKTRIQITSKYL